MIDIGLALTLQINHGQPEQTYRSKVIDLDEQYIYIDIPVNDQTNESANVRLGTNIVVSYIGKDHALYSFQSKVKERKKLTVPALVIERGTHITRKQRRQFVRVDTTVDVAIHPIDESIPPFTTMTVDLSAGGLSFILPQNITINQNIAVHLTIVLIMQSTHYEYIHCKGKILRVTMADDAPQRASVKFTHITEKDQQKIMKYAMEKQREARQRELNL